MLVALLVDELWVCWLFSPPFKFTGFETDTLHLHVVNDAAPVVRGVKSRDSKRAVKGEKGTRPLRVRSFCKENKSLYRGHRPIEEKL